MRSKFKVQARVHLACFHTCVSAVVVLSNDETQRIRLVNTMRYISTTAFSAGFFFAEGEMCEGIVPHPANAWEKGIEMSTKA